MEMHTKVIDLHCDTLSHCYASGIGLANDGQLAVSLEKRPRGLHICQVMAIFMPDEFRGREAEEYFGRIYQTYYRQMQVCKEQVARVLELDTIDQALEARPFAVMLSVEGGSALAGRLGNVKTLYSLGVRMMTLTWNQANEICGGCATQKGFTKFGRKAVQEMEKLGIIVDVSHLSDVGFWELCEFSQRPFVASHSNARAVCDHRRNLTDDMFKTIRDRGGIVGLNYYDNFIVEGGGSKSIDDLLRHVHHFLELGGEDTLALGSDYDGAEIPEYLDSMEKVEFLFEAMLKSGIPAGVVEKIQYKNANRFFQAYAG